VIFLSRPFFNYDYFEPKKEIIMSRFNVNFLIPVLLTLILVIPSGFINAQNIEQSLSSLRGINKVGVIIEKVSQVLFDNGIKEDDFKKDIAENLDYAGITVLSNPEMHNLPGSPYLYLNIGAVKSKTEDFYAVSLSLEFRQDVNLSRNPKQKYYSAATWSDSNVGIFTKDKLNDIKDYAKKMVDKFVKDYLKANKIDESK
jgi:hypothetical protein